MINATPKPCERPLAIIPAKGHSTRLPGKNMLPLGGLPLCLHSAYYARQEGAEPLVATDSEQIAAAATAAGVRVLRISLPGGDAPMEHTVREVVEAMPGVEHWALLQPTSPLREPGALRSMLARLAGGSAHSLYTAPMVKPQGHIGSLFLPGYRAQDTPAWIRPFDGSIIAFTRAHWQRWGSYLSPQSEPVLSAEPTCRQVDTPEDFTLLETLAAAAPYRHLLPGRTGLRVAIVTNAHHCPHDYRPLLAGMDEVWRVNRVENLGSAWSGTRMDAALLTIGPCFLSHKAAARGDARFRGAPQARLWYAPEWATPSHAYARALGISLWAPAPKSLPGTYSTTAGRAVALALYLHPGAHIHWVGETSAALRTHGHPHHSTSGETEWLTALAATGQLTIHHTQ